MGSRSTRNTLLAAGAAFGVMSAVLVVVSSSLSFADILSVPAFKSLKVAVGLFLLGSVFTLAAFGAGLVGFLLESRRVRRTVLAVSAGLFAASGVSGLAGPLTELIQEWDYHQPWTYTAGQCAGAAAGLSLAVAALLALIGVLSSRPDRLLGWASIGLAGHFGLLAASYSFELAWFLTFGVPGTTSWGLGTTAAGQLVAAGGAVVAAVAFLVAAGRQRRGELWGAEREGSLGSAAIVLALGFAVATVGMILLAWLADPSSRNEAEQWLQVVAELLLALAAACGAIGFFVSRRELRAAPQS